MNQSGLWSGLWHARVGPWVQSGESAAWRLPLSAPEAQVLLDELEEMGVEGVVAEYKALFLGEAPAYDVVFWVTHDKFFNQRDLWILAGVGSSVARWLYLMLDEAGVAES